jgi:hypothetical protein
VTTPNQAMIKTSPNIYEQSSPPAMISTTIPSYVPNDFLRSNSMHFDYGSMHGFWPPHLYDTNSYHHHHHHQQQHPPTIHS